MADAIAEIDARIAQLEQLSEMPAAIGPKVAVALEREILGNVARGVGPDGKPWAPTADGHKPLQGVASSLTVRADGPLVVAHLEGVHARHHTGHVRGGVARPILPSSASPSLVRAIEGVAAAEFERVTR